MVEKMKAAAVLLILAVAGCGSDGDGGRDRNPGHITMGDSFNMKSCGDDIERDDGIHYVTRGADAPISGTMRLVYEIQASADAVFVPTEGDSSPRITLYFQRDGDDWSASGKYGAYRWFSAKRWGVASGAYTIEAPLVFDSWRAVSGAAGTPENFAAATNDAERVGFVFGGGNVGHGVCLTSGTAKFIVKSFTVG